MLYVKESSSTSVADKLRLLTPSSSKLTSDTSFKIGASFTGVIFKFKDFVSDNSPSETDISRDKLPKKSWTPVIFKILPLNEVETFSLLDAKYNNVELSISEPLRGIDIVPSSANSEDEILARIGGSLTGFTVTINSSDTVTTPSVANT